jgi:hypothetical protein
MGGTRRDVLSLLLVVALFFVIRLPLYTAPGVILGWNSDSALIGLMARAMAESHDVPPFFVGQHYLGTLTPFLTSLFSSITPLTLRLVVSFEVLLALLFFWAAFRRAFGAMPALLATLWLAAGPAFLFQFTAAPLAVEQLLLVAAVLFWCATRAHPQWFLVGLLFGFGMWLHQGILFLGAAVAAARWRERRVAAFAAGALLGYLPAALELLRGDPVLYHRVIPSWSLIHVFDNIVETLRSDLWLLLADASAFGIATAIALIALAIFGLRDEPWTPPKIIAVLTIAISAAFWLFSTYPYAGAVRYIAPVVPFVFVAAAMGVAKLPRAFAVAAALLITLALFVPRVQQARDIAAGRSEQYTNWPGGFDPRPTLRVLKSGGYRVCYGEVWVAHKLEWISSPTVRFVPVRSVHRTLLQSLQLIRDPAPKCFVDNDGRVTALTPRDEAIWRESVLRRAEKAGLLLH